MEWLGLADLVAVLASAKVSSCEHCRTVTWAGVPACECEFGRLATDEVGIAVLVGMAGGAGGERSGA